MVVATVHDAAALSCESTGMLGAARIVARGAARGAAAARTAGRRAAVTAHNGISAKAAVRGFATGPVLSKDMGLPENMVQWLWGRKGVKKLEAAVLEKDRKAKALLDRSKYETGVVKDIRLDDLHNPKSVFTRLEIRVQKMVKYDDEHFPVPFGGHTYYDGFEWANQIHDAFFEELSWSFEKHSGIDLYDMFKRHKESIMGIAKLFIICKLVDIVFEAMFDDLVELYVDPLKRELVEFVDEAREDGTDQTLRKFAVGWRDEYRENTLRYNKWNSFIQHLDLKTKIDEQTKSIREKAKELKMVDAKLEEAKTEYDKVIGAPAEVTLFDEFWRDYVIPLGVFGEDTPQTDAHIKRCKESIDDLLATKKKIETDLERANSENENDIDELAKKWKLYRIIRGFGFRFYLD